MVSGVPRREKIYCDKWIHDGTCAFTQQGCKFLHEMPVDKETQVSVGLFTGLPSWYRRQQADQQMVRYDDRPVTLGGGAVGYGGGGPALAGRGDARFNTPGGAFGNSNWRQRIESGNAAPAHRFEPAPAPPAQESPSYSSVVASGADAAARGGGRGGARGAARVGKQSPWSTLHRWPLNFTLPIY